MKSVRIKIIKNGPYRVTGGLPLSEQVIVTDEAGHSTELVEKKNACSRKPISYAVAVHPKIIPSAMEHI